MRCGGCGVKRALLVCYGAGHANLLAPVHERLLREGRMSSVALALSVAKHTFRERALPYQTISDYRSMILDADAERYGRQLADRWHVESSGLSREESVLYLGASMRDLILEVGPAEAWRRIETSGRQGFLPLATMDRIIAAQQPDVIVATNSPRMERAATLVGNRRGIPTLNVHDDLGFFARDYLLTADRIAVMSQITKDNLIAQGHDPERIIVTGQPAFDTIPEERRRLRRQEIIQAMGLPGAGPYLLLGTSQPGQRGQVMGICPVACEALAAMTRYHLIVKPHPGEDAEAYRAYARQWNGRVSVISGVSIRPLLFVSELLITFASTITLEALLMGRPIISLNLTGAPDPLPFVRWGLGVEAHTVQELQAAVRTVTDDQAFREQFTQACARYIHPTNDGGATERVVQLIYHLANVNHHAPV